MALTTEDIQAIRQMMQEELEPIKVQLEELGPMKVQLAELGPMKVQLEELGPMKVQLEELGPMKAQLAELGPIKEKLAELEEHAVVTRSAVNSLVEWADTVGVITQVKFPIKKATNE